MDKLDTSAKPAPVCGILSVAVTPLALLFAYLTSAFLESLLGKPAYAVTYALSSFRSFAILTSLVMGIAGLIRRERLGWLSVIGWLVTVGTVGLLLCFDKDG